MSKTWDEIVAERKGITIEEQIAEETQEKNIYKSKIENIQNTINAQLFHLLWRYYLL